MTLDERLRRAALRILHLPNESTTDPLQHQVGPRDALAAMQESGRIQALETFSFLARRNAGANWQRELLDIASDFGPDLVVWQNVGDVAVDPRTLRALKEGTSSPKLMYHDGDPYGRIVKRPTTDLRSMFHACDLALVVGSGRFARIARRAGAARVAAVVQPYDDHRFGVRGDDPPQPQIDAVMIGNLGSTRVPGVLMPGGRRRRAFAQLVADRLGPDRFALYGDGWDDNPCARGRTPYLQQTTTIRNARISVNWDHFDTEPAYASDRLAISLAAGVPHLTCRHAGYEAQYGDCKGLLLADSVDEAVDLLEWTLGHDDETIQRWGAAGRRFAEANLEARTVWRQWIDLAVRELFPERLR